MGGDASAGIPPVNRLGDASAGYLHPRNKTLGTAQCSGAPNPPALQAHATRGTIPPRPPGSWSLNDKQQGRGGPSSKTLREGRPILLNPPTTKQMTGGGAHPRRHGPDRGPRSKINSLQGRPRGPHTSAHRMRHLRAQPAAPAQGAAGVGCPLHGVQPMVSPPWGDLQVEGTTCKS